MSDPTPTPLTDEQIEQYRVQIRAYYVNAMCEAGDDYAETYGTFDAWLAAVIARAKRGERERLFGRIANQMPERGAQILMTPYREGVIDGVNRALRVLEATQ